MFKRIFPIGAACIAAVLMSMPDTTLARHGEAMQPLVVAWERADRFSLETAVLVWAADWAREAAWLREAVQVQARRHLLRDTVDPAAPAWEPPGSAGPADRQSGGGW